MGAVDQLKLFEGYDAAQMTLRSTTVPDKHGVKRSGRVSGTFEGTCISVQEWTRRDGTNERLAIIELDQVLIVEVDDDAEPEHDDGEQPRLDGTN
jgi:hypothetical protein